MTHTVQITNERDENGGYVVYLDGDRLDPERSLKLRNHSPSGFAFGYAGSGPSQLALAILLEVTTEEKALALYRDFKFDFVSRWQIDDEVEEGNAAKIILVDIEAWLERKV